MQIQQTCTKGYFLDNLKPLIDSSRFPAALCIMKNDIPTFPTLLYCNELLEKVLQRNKEELINEQFNLLFDTEVFNSKYIAFLKNVKNFYPAAVKVKFDSPDDQVKYFSIGFHPITFLSSNTEKYCLLEYIEIEDLKTNPLEVHGDVLELKGAQLVNSDLYLDRIYRKNKLLQDVELLISTTSSLKEVFGQVSRLLIEYFKCDRCVLHSYEQDSKISYFVESGGVGLSRLTSKVHKRDRLKYVAYVNKFMQKDSKTDDVYQNKVLLIDKNNLNDERLMDLCEKFNVKSQLILEKFLLNNVFLRIYVHQCTNARRWSTEEIELLEKCLNYLGIALERNQGLQRMQVINEELQIKTKQLRESLKKEKEMREIQHEFIAMVSHQFKNPLQIIEGSRSVINRKVNKSTDIEKDVVDESLNKIKSAVFRLNNLINKTLNLSRLETTGSIDVSEEFINIPELIEEILTKNVVESKKKIKITLSFETLPKDFVLMGDRKLLDHAFSNLIDNAIKYSKEEGDIKISGEISNNRFVLKIKDNGIGIPEKDGDKIFNKFSRGTNALNVSGTGVGLYLVKRFIELHNGTINFNSEFGIGTTFYVSFPINYINNNLENRDAQK